MKAQSRCDIAFRGILVFCFGRIILFAINEDPDQMPHNVASDLGLHCLPIFQVVMG